MLSDMDLDQSCAVAEDVRAAIEAWPWPLREVTVSVGVACYEGDVGSPSKVIAKADEALYVSKQSGRNRVTRSEPGSKAA